MSVGQQILNNIASTVLDTGDVKSNGALFLISGTYSPVKGQEPQCLQGTALSAGVYGCRGAIGAQKRCTYIKLGIRGLPGRVSIRAEFETKF